MSRCFMDGYLAALEKCGIIIHNETQQTTKRSGSILDKQASNIKKLKESNGERVRLPHDI